jgi:mono/diheme cytochrome c family protein
MKVYALCGCLAAALVSTGYSQTKPSTVLDGVYTEQQAQRGQERYEAICAACHEGTEPEANPPKGSEFIEKWRGAPLSFLYNFIRTSMPGDKPGTLSAKEYVDVTAYLLQANGYRAGASDLTTEKTNGILLVGPEGPKPLPPNALVSAVGCLTAASDNDWTLTSATSPVRVRVSDQTTPEELATSSTAPLGQASYKLTNTDDFPAAKLKGQKVQAKGVLTKVENPYKLSIQSLERAGDACGK